MKSREQQRRSLLKALGVGSFTLVSGTAIASSPVVVKPSSNKQTRYQATDHVQSYYQTLKD
ncbi:formate dehydrogenase [Ferrimonas aestuarii]|uniref:Formate dehydrogenase n=1 Tax=Ferrimonas aestuarii TaxID=2569539 RepID=A0A4U1BQE2_9GAMM|nr:formate dehydrogenase [Ferrimonas aestuarii]TKB54997.1 formate dehydrogenase [Ferrimonas aestuarii]